MLDEIAVLVERGVRVGVLHIESFRYLPERRQPLSGPVQEFINTGQVVQVLAYEPRDVDLVLVQSPAMLQFAATEPSEIRAKQVVIRASRAPSGRDGSDYQYVPAACTDAARRIFGRDPMWCPQGPAVREQLAAELAPAELAPFDLPGVIDTAKWRVDRGRFRSDLPIVGKHSRDSWTTTPADRETLLQVYPDSPEVDVRMMGGTGALRAALGAGHLPANWLVYDFDEVGVRAFLNQLDFYVYFPPPSAAETFSRGVLEALATGCVAILPRRFAGMFGDAARYCDPPEVWATVQRYYSQPDLYLDQSRRAQERVRREYGEDAYFKLLSGLIA
jgi:hypothetical protein